MSSDIKKVVVKLEVREKMYTKTITQGQAYKICSHQFTNRCEYNFKMLAEKKV